MKKLTILSLIFISTTAFSQDSLSYDRTEVEALLLKDLEIRLDKWFSGDGSGYLDGFANNFTYWDPLLEGKRFETLDALKDEFDGRKTDFEYYGIQVPVFQHFNGQIILTCNVAHNFFGGMKMSWSATEVFQLIDGEWKIIHAHWSAYGPGLFQFPTLFLIIGAILLLIITFFIGVVLGKRKQKLTKESIQE